MRPLSGEIPVPEEKGKDAPMAPRKRDRESSDRPVSLKILADYLGLCPATVSVVLNNVPGRSIPQETRERVRAAARKFNYQPSLLARSLRKRRTFTVGVLVPELSDGYHTLVMSGIGDHLMREGYFYFSAHHRHKPDLVDEYPRLLMGRGAAGITAIGAIRALRDANLRVPEDVSVIGFDDINVAAYHTPRLTTIRQPLHDMGEIAARILLQRLQGFKNYPEEFAVPPELIIRETTVPPSTKSRKR